MNLRRALAWFHRRLVNLAEAGALRVLWERRWVHVCDEQDIDAWLAGQIPPSLVRERQEAPLRLVGQGVEVG